MAVDVTKVHAVRGFEDGRAAALVLPKAYEGMNQVLTIEIEQRRRVAHGVTAICNEERWQAS